MFLLGILFGFVLVFLFKKIKYWLLARVLPVQYLQEYSVRYRNEPKSKKEITRGN